MAKFNKKKMSSSSSTSFEATVSLCRFVLHSNVLHSLLVQKPLKPLTVYIIYVACSVHF